MHEIIPAAFLDKMKLLLGSDFNAFCESYKLKRTYGLRVNTLKIRLTDFLHITPFALQPIPWTTAGFYYDEYDRPGRHPYHAAGLYYIQEPSAMAAVELLHPQPGEIILDLAAAPGGKATQIAAAMQGKGLLVANEPFPARAKILSENIERLGIQNAVVTNETPEALAKKFTTFFDRILLDAPCSGEGMFRKDPESCKEWKKELPEFCARRQWDIFVQAEKMLKPGGYLLYSTCTFAPEENEQLTARVLENYPDIELVIIPLAHGFKRAQSKWANQDEDRVGGAVRLWPQLLQGEGHYIALFHKKNNGMADVRTHHSKKVYTARVPEFEAFVRETLQDVAIQDYRTFGKQLYYCPSEMLPLDGLKVLRPGLHLGTLQKGRFEPSHAFALALKRENVKIHVDVSADSLEVQKYLKGETLPQTTNSKGWTLVTVDGFSLGWGKQSDGLLKNHYPKGLRQ